MPRAIIWTILHIPEGSRLHPGTELHWLRLAVARALAAQMTDAVAWRELGLLTGRQAAINVRPVLFGNFHDDDYVEAIHEIVDDLLGIREYPRHTDGVAEWHIHVDGLRTLEEHLELPEWLARNEPRLHRLLYGPDPAQAAALDAVTTTIAELELPEIVRQLERLRRDFADDLPAAVGHAKDLVESACKTVLGESGPGAGSMKFPTLVAAALKATGRHPQQIDPNDPDAELLRRLLGALNTQLDVIAGLRNRVGAGHGRAGDVALDAPLARLVVGQALVAVAYLLHAVDRKAVDGRTLAEGTEADVTDGGTP